MTYYPEWEQIGREFPRTNLPAEFLNSFDVIISMHMPEFITENWEKMKHKKVIFRSIGQSTQHVENMIRRMRYEGLKVIRYSPMEENIVGYVGGDAMIRFYKDENEWKDWTGHEKRVINFTQSLKGRRAFCHYDDIMSMINGFPALVYGPGNEDLGGLNGGELPYDLMKGALRDNRCYVYAGTWPAPYSLSFMEAFMTGIPIVSIGPRLAEDIPEIGQNDRLRFFEIGNFIQHGHNGFISDNINELRDCIHQLLEDHELAKRIGEAGRKTALELFAKQPILEQWRTFLDQL